LFTHSKTDIVLCLQYSMFNEQMTLKEFNMYLITDSFGTRQRAWSRTEALAWLAKCSDTAFVHDCFGRLVATRVVA
jgi:hypothetical protein